MSRPTWHEKDVIVGVHGGLHVRPSASVADACRQYPHDIRLEYGTADADAKEPVGILSLGVGKGQRVRVKVSTRYPDYLEVADAIGRILEDREGGLRYGDERSRSRLGVIGLGTYAAGRFLSHLKGHPLVEVTAAAAPEDVSAKAGLLEKIGLSSGQYFKLENGAVPEGFFEGIDLAYVCSPPWVHREQTVQAASRGILTMTEKPLVVTRREMASLKAAAETGDFSHRLFPCDHYLYKPVAMYLRSRAQDLLAGRPLRRATAVLFEGRGKDNLIGLGRQDWLLTPRAGGGVMMDTGVHLGAVLTKLCGLEFLSCEKARLYDLYAEQGFACESGCFAEYRAREPLEGRDIPVTLLVAKGTTESKKEVLLEGDGHVLRVDFIGGTVELKGSLAAVGETAPEHLVMLAECLQGRGGMPWYTLDDARRSLDPVWMAYEKAGDSWTAMISDPGEIAAFERAAGLQGEGDGR